MHTQQNLLRAPPKLDLKIVPPGSFMIIGRQTAVIADDPQQPRLDISSHVQHAGLPIETMQGLAVVATVMIDAELIRHPDMAAFRPLDVVKTAGQQKAQTYYPKPPYQTHSRAVTRRRREN